MKAFMIFAILIFLNGCAGMGGIDQTRLQNTFQQSVNGAVNGSVATVGGTTECVASGITAGVGQALVEKFAKKLPYSYYPNMGKMEYQSCLQQQRFARMQAEQMRQQMAWREAEERRRMAPRCRYRTSETAKGGVRDPKQEARECQAESYEEFRGQMVLK